MPAEHARLAAAWPREDSGGRPWTLRVVVVGLMAASVAACSANRPPRLDPAVGQPSVAPLPVVPPDPLSDVLQQSRGHFEAGVRAYEQRQWPRGRDEFTRALDVLLESPQRPLQQRRAQIQFDSFVELIGTWDATSVPDASAPSAATSPPVGLATVDASLDRLVAESPAAAAVPVRPRVPIPLNDEVLHYLALFQGRLRTWMADGLLRAGPYLPMIRRTLMAEGLPVDLAYLPLVESSFQAVAVSEAQAQGLWQFMSATGASLGLAQDPYVDERADPEKSTQAAARYLADLAASFEGDWPLTLAAYNSGPGRIRSAIDRVGGADFWALARAGAVPRETREYVPMLLAVMLVARDPGAFGFQLPLRETYGYDTMLLPEAVQLDQIAEWAGTGVDDLQALNPELRWPVTPRDRSSYALKLPPGSAELVRFHAAGVDLRTLRAEWYVVQRGDSVWKLARRFGVSMDDLARVNALGPDARLQIGQRLTLPPGATAGAPR